MHSLSECIITRTVVIFIFLLFFFSSLGYIVGSGVSTLVFTSFKQADSWRWALRVSSLHKLTLVGMTNAMVFYLLVIVLKYHASLHTERCSWK